jgi:hypothetical protein
MTALSLETAKNIGMIVAAALLVLTLAAAWAIKNITSKLLAVIVLGGLCIGVWTQRSNVQDCATKAKERVTAGDTRPITCTFFGSDVNVGRGQ